MRSRKYNEKKTPRHGRWFDSIAEADRATELLAMLARGEIRNLMFQPRFVLQAAFTDNVGVRERAIRYTPDFQYEKRLANGEWPEEIRKIVAVEEVKGKRTDAYIMRRKLFRKQYCTDLIFPSGQRISANYTFREIGVEQKSSRRTKLSKKLQARVVGGAEKEMG